MADWFPDGSPYPSWIPNLMWLVEKYQSVLDTMKSLNATMMNVNGPSSSDQIYICGYLASQSDLDQVLAQINFIDAVHADLDYEITVGAPLLHVKPLLQNPLNPQFAAPLTHYYPVYERTTLPELSFRLYGDPGLWPQIYTANRDWIKLDGWYVAPMQTLVIPDPLRGSQLG